VLAFGAGEAVDKVGEIAVEDEKDVEDTEDVEDKTVG
jgi:hypothetical protein